jgi:hypothetical protein
MLNNVTDLLLCCYVGPTVYIAELPPCVMVGVLAIGPKVHRFKPH